MFGAFRAAPASPGHSPGLCEGWRAALASQRWEASPLPGLCLMPWRAPLQWVLSLTAESHLGYQENYSQLLGLFSQGLLANFFREEHL